MARKSKETQSFGAGFMVGVLAGIIGYLAFGTDKGEDFRKNLRDKLEEARKILYQEGVIDAPDMPLPEVVAALREQAEALLEAAAKSKAGVSQKKEKFRGL